MELWKCNKIFLTTDDIDILQIFKDEFEDSVVSSNRRYTKYVVCETQDGNYIKHITPPERKNGKYLDGLEYLTDIVILSRCNCIVGSTTCGTIAAVLMSDGFEHSYFFNCGLYGITNDVKCGKYSADIDEWVV